MQEDKQREEFISWHRGEFWYHPDEVTISEELRSLAWQREKAWKAAQAAMQPRIARLTDLCDKYMWQVRDTCNRAEIAEKKLSAAQQEIADLRAGEQCEGTAYRMEARSLKRDLDLSNGLLLEEQSMTEHLRDALHGYFENKAKLEQQLSERDARIAELEAQFAGNVTITKEKFYPADKELIESLEKKIAELEAFLKKVIVAKWYGGAVAEFALEAEQLVKEN